MENFSAPEEEIKNRVPRVGSERLWKISAIIFALFLIIAGWILWTNREKISYLNSKSSESDDTSNVVEEIPLNLNRGSSQKSNEISSPKIQKSPYVEIGASAQANILETNKAKSSKSTSSPKQTETVQNSAAQSTSSNQDETENAAVIAQPLSTDEIADVTEPEEFKIEITEIMYDLEGTDTGREWVEILNSGPTQIDITDWKFFEANNNHKLTINQGVGTISPGSRAIIVDKLDGFLLDNPNYSGIIIDSTFSLSNTGELLAIKDVNGKIIDQVTYSKEWGANGDGNSLQKINGIWTSTLPTPGQ